SSHTHTHNDTHTHTLNDTQTLSMTHTHTLNDARTHTNTLNNTHTHTQQWQLGEQIGGAAGGSSPQAQCGEAEKEQESPELRPPLSHSNPLLTLSAPSHTPAEGYFFAKLL